MCDDDNLPLENDVLGSFSFCARHFIVSILLFKVVSDSTRNQNHSHHKSKKKKNEKSEADLCFQNTHNYPVYFVVHVY